MGLILDELGGEFAVGRLPAEAPPPSWAAGTLVSVTRTPGEVSVVCDAAAVLQGATAARGSCTAKSSLRRGTLRRAGHTVGG